MTIDARQPGSLPQQLVHSCCPLSRLAKLLACLSFFFIILPDQAHSQQGDLPFEDVPVGEGIPTNVQHILQDRTGYLWFATWSGLYKHDGYNFVCYKHDRDDTTSLFDNTLNVLYEDRAGVLWIGSYLGLERFDPKSETFIHYNPNPPDSGDNRTNQIWAICEDKYGMLWVGSGNGLHTFDRVTKEFTSLRHDSTDPGSIAHGFVSAIYEDKEGTLWFGTGAGLDKLDRQAGKFVHCVPGYWVNSLYVDDTGCLWLGTEEGLVEYDHKAGTFSSYRLDPSKPWSRDDTGMLWLAVKAGTSSKYHLDPTKPQDRINSICQDILTGSLWSATGRGLFRFDRKSKTLTHYDYKVTCVYSERSGTLWVGTSIGLKKLNRTYQPFTRYPSEDVVSAICNWNDGKLWLYTFHGWKQFDTRKEKITPYSFRTGYLFYVWNIVGTDISIRTWKGTISIQDRLGNVTFSLDSCWKDYVDGVTIGWNGKKGYWAGFASGDLDLWEPRTNRVLKVRNLKQRIFWLYEDTFGLVWASTYMGSLFCYDYGKDSLVEFVSDAKDTSTISGKQISHIYEDRKRRLWFATNAGLDRYERATNSFVHFTEKNGLQSNNVRGIVEDDHGCLWLSTSKGISKFDPETRQCKNYDVSYGVEPASDIFYGGGCRTENGEIYFGGAKGFTRFHPDSIKDNPFIPPIVITSFKKFDKPVPFSGEVRLPYDENFLSFEFAALSYVSPERNQYAYKMEGLDKDWVYAGARRFASYPGLEPGDYVFRVKGSNNDGVWNEVGTSLPINIAPPLWKTTWAYISYSMLLLSLLYLTWKLQMKRIRMAHEYEMSRFEAEKLHEMDEMKSRFFANVSHEFRTPLTLILGPVKEMIQRANDETTRNDLWVVHRNANRLLGLVNQLLDVSKLESGTMMLRTVPQNTVPLLKALVLSFTSYAERKRITLTFNSTEDEIPAYIDRDKVEKIITNILSNAFKFTPEGGRIDVDVARDERFVKIRISDTGIGIQEEKMPKIFDRFYQVDGSHTREQEGTGIGLSLTKELAELHKGTIEVESTEGEGTTFTIGIPLGKEHLKPEEICEPGKGDKETSLIMEQAPAVQEDMAYDQATTTSEPDISSVMETEEPLLLIVEDNVDVRNYIRNNVKMEYRILEAVDGEDGWNKSIEQMPDVIVSDVMMPKMDGFRLCEKLKTDERTSHIPVILLTAKAASQDKIEGYDTGADDYIVKPFEPEEVKARIRNLIEQRKRLHEHFRKHGLFEIEEEKITPVDQKFLQKTVAVITEHMSDAAFGVETLASEVAVSRSFLLKKIDALIGEPPSELIKRTRLNKAAQLIEDNYGNISEIALEVGFNNPSYFGECFKKQFGCTPSQYHRSSLQQ
jgi:signal transduction histidine kinase/ligand-binding sensor domain-containing protein/DNA-binding response OmpR family regulator